jgi:hypothetical protein
MSDKKGFFHLPTWALIAISILAVGATIFDVYLLFNTATLDSITVNGVEYLQGTEQYNAGIKVMQKSFGFSALFTLATCFLTGWFGYKRIKNIKEQSNKSLENRRA